jgi:hypothetical protein
LKSHHCELFYQNEVYSDLSKSTNFDKVNKRRRKERKETKRKKVQEKTEDQKRKGRDGINNRKVESNQATEGKELLMKMNRNLLMFTCEMQRTDH